MYILQTGIWLTDICPTQRLINKVTNLENNTKSKWFNRAYTRQLKQASKIQDSFCYIILSFFPLAFFARYNAEMTVQLKQ